MAKVVSIPITMALFPLKTITVIPKNTDLVRKILLKLELAMVISGPITMALFPLKMAVLPKY